MNTAIRGIYNNGMIDLIEKPDFQGPVEVLIVFSDRIFNDDKNDRKKDFTDIFGVWSQADLREFEQAVEDFGQIDPGDWR